MSAAPQRVVKLASRDVRVKVVVRVRPLLEHEGDETCVNILDDQSIEIDRDSQCLQYKFDSCYGESITQAELYRNEIKALVMCPLTGQNASCFAYGPTGAGKTHTMQGTPEDPGIIPRVVNQLFKEIQRQSEAGELKFTVTVSYMEIYNEKVYDLLEFKDSDLPIREDLQHNILIPGLIEKELRSYEDFTESFSAALSNRSTAPTKMNTRSSRSHAVMLIKVNKTELKYPYRTYLGKMHLVDLAGSEDNRRTDNAGQRLKESGAINRSLFVLSQVVEALNRGDARIPYRDSKLTRLLQDSLGGDSHACMIANVAPGANYFMDTYNCLNFASKSRKIVNRTTVQRVAPQPAPPPPKPIFTAPPVRVKTLEPPKEAKAALSTTAKAPAKAATGEPLRTTPELARKASAPALKVATKPAKPSPLAPAAQEQTVSRRDSDLLAVTAMTPASKTQYAKACIIKAKLFEKNNRFGEALKLFEEARALVPDSEKLDTRIANIKARIGGPDSGQGSPMTAASGPARKAPAKKVLGVIGNKPEDDGSMHSKAKRAHDDDDDDNTPEPAGKRRRSSRYDPSWQPTPEVDSDDAEVIGVVPMEDSARVSPTGCSIKLNASLALRLERDLLNLLNTGSAKELMKINGVGKKRALNVIQFREQERPLQQLSDLHLCGFGKKLVDSLIKENIVIQFQ